MSKLISVLFQKEENKKGYLVKQLYCYKCGAELFGECKTFEKEDLIFVGRPEYNFWQQPLWYYHCYNCGWGVSGDEAFLIYFQFRENII